MCWGGLELARNVKTLWIAHSLHDKGCPGKRPGLAVSKQGPSPVLPLTQGTPR